MPDHRRHRGAHPDDEHLFSQEAEESLRQAASDFSWLLTRSYASESSLKLVGDRYRLRQRQRTAVARATSSQQQQEMRRASQLDQNQIAQETVHVDGYNLLITIEAALGGGVLLHSQDACLRDMASMHGTYRKVTETVPALVLIGKQLERVQTADVNWYLDRPVSNSGRLKKLIQELAEEHHWNWKAELVDDPDPILKEMTDEIVISADSAILDVSNRWLNLASLVVFQSIPDAWILDLTLSENEQR